MDMVTHKKHNETGTRNSLIYTGHICSKIDIYLSKNSGHSHFELFVAVRYFRENTVV